MLRPLLGSGRQGQRYRRAAKELTEEVQGRTPPLPAAPPHRHQHRLRPRTCPRPAATPDLSQDDAEADRQFRTPVGGVQPRRKERVALSAVVNSAVETTRPLLEAMGHELALMLPEQPVILDADFTRLAQVFSNLLNNAAKYSGPGGHIRLAAERQGSDVVVSVTDTGVGIPTDKLTSIFEMFAQVDGSLEKSQGGLGIGLTLVKRLVEMHEGTIEAHSDGMGKGSEFLVRLPVVIEVPHAQAVRHDEPALQSSHRILIVDDNRDSADSLAMMLQFMGNEIRTAYDGQEAVAVAGDFRPDVVLLDIGLPKLNGYEACRRIRVQPWGKDLVLIAVTGWGQDEDRRRSHEAGFDHHMVKPVDPHVLRKLLSGLEADEVVLRSS